MKHSFDKTTIELIGQSIVDAHTFWRKRRLLFNIIVGLSGIGSILLYGNYNVGPGDLFAIFAWGIIANVAYCVGYLIDANLIVNSKGIGNFPRVRLFLFWTGTIAYVMLNLIYAMQYYSHLHN